MSAVNLCCTKSSCAGGPGRPPLPALLRVKRPQSPLQNRSARPASRDLPARRFQLVGNGPVPNSGSSRWISIAALVGSASSRSRSLTDPQPLVVRLTTKAQTRNDFAIEIPLAADLALAEDPFPGKVRLRQIGASPAQDLVLLLQLGSASSLHEAQRSSSFNPGFRHPQCQTASARHTTSPQARPAVDRGLLHSHPAPISRTTSSRELL